MTDHRYETPDAGTLDWHVPMNDNFEALDTDVELRDVEANLDSYTPSDGAKFLATDSGAVYTGDGSAWSLVGYVARAVGGGLGHYANYADGLSDEPVNEFVFTSDETLEVTRIAFPMKGVSDGTIESDATLRVYEGGVGGTLIVELDGNDLAIASSSSSGPWVATTSPVTVTVTNATGATIDAIPKVWANIRK